MWLPTYMREELQFNLNSSGVYSFLPYIALFILSIFSGRIADYMLEFGFEKTKVRKLFQSLGTLLPALFLGTLCSHPDRRIAVGIMVTHFNNFF